MIIKEQVGKIPDKIVPTDYLGNEFISGKSVAFNYQGSVRLGTIKKVKRNEWKKFNSSPFNNLQQWELIFELLIDNPIKQNGDTIVRNTDSVVVLD